MFSLAQSYLTVSCRGGVSGVRVSLRVQTLVFAGTAVQRAVCIHFQRPQNPFKQAVKFLC